MRSLIYLIDDVTKLDVVADNAKSHCPTSPITEPSLKGVTSPDRARGIRLSRRPRLRDDYVAPTMESLASCPSQASPPRLPPKPPMSPAKTKTIRKVLVPSPATTALSPGQSERRWKSSPIRKILSLDRAKLSNVRQPRRSHETAEMINQVLGELELPDDYLE